MKKRIEQFYATFGDSGIMFILYAVSLVVNCLLTLTMELPAIFPDEISVAGTAAFLAGKNWSHLLGSIETSGGYIQSLFYVPLFQLFSTPFAIYKAMLVVNALLISFVPLIVYHIAAKLGVVRVRHKLLISLMCGFYVSYIAGSKFIWNETITSLLCWLMVLSVFTAWDRKTKSARFSMSCLLGFLFAVAYAANPQLIALDITILVTILIAHIALREKVVNFWAFSVTCVLSFLAEHFVSVRLKADLWGENIGVSFHDSLSSFFASFYSGFYAFMTSTIGIGALAAAITMVLLFSVIREGTRKKAESPESDAKVYEPVNHKYSMRLTLFAVFQFVAVGFSEIFSSMLVDKAVAEYASSKGYCGDNLAPFALFLVLVFVVHYGIQLKHLLYGMGIYAYSCFCFVVMCYSSMGETEHTDLLSTILPLIGITGTNNSSMSYLIISSCVFTLYALLIVYASCSRKHRTALVSVTLLCVFTISTIFLNGIFIPAVGRENSELVEPYVEVFNLLYNTPQSPPIVIYSGEQRLAGTIQFLAPDTPVSIVEKGGKIPESCLLIAESSVQLPKGIGSYDSVGKTQGYTVYAFGETALNYIRFNSGTGREIAVGRKTLGGNA